jgi:hypothetical protein
MRKDEREHVVIQATAGFVAKRKALARVLKTPINELKPRGGPSIRRWESVGDRPRAGSQKAALTQLSPATIAAAYR